MYIIKVKYYDDILKEDRTEYRLVVADGVTTLGATLADLYDSDAIIEYTATAIGDGDTDQLLITEEIAELIKAFYKD